MDKRGFFILDITTWLIAAPLVILLLLSVLGPTVKQFVDLRQLSNEHREVILIDQSITIDLMRGNQIQVADALVINGAEYYVEKNELIRRYENKKHSLGRGEFNAELDNKELKVCYNGIELVYSIFWSDYNE